MTTLAAVIGTCAPVAAEEERTLLVLGDSLTKGYGVLEDEAFPGLLGEKLDGLGDGEWRVVNGGVSGDTSAGGLRRLPWLLKAKPDALVLALGGNDGLRGIDPASTEANLREIIGKARAANPEIRILLAGVAVPENMGAEYVARFAAAFRKVAESERIPLVPDILAGVAGVPELNLEDRIHPNPAGYRKIAETLWAALEPLVSAPESP